VAQQYLPVGLQGKVFYRPSDQGYEDRIRERVSRRREEQLSAMLETAAPEDALTWSPPSRQRDRWLQRTAQGTSQYLAEIRTLIFDPLALRRHDTVLDVGASTGLLTWEALRQVPEGGVVTLARDQASAEAIEQGSALLEALERPRVLQGSVADLPALLEAAGEGELRFEAIVGRNVFGASAEQGRSAEVLAGLLAPGGRISLAEVLPYRAQRLSALVDLSSLSEVQQRAIGEAESALYSAPHNARASLDEAGLAALFQAAGLEVREARAVSFERDQLITAEQVDAWFARGTDSPSYADRMALALDDELLSVLQTLYRSQLAGQVVKWASQVAFVVAQRPN